MILRVRNTNVLHFDASAFVIFWYNMRYVRFGDYVCRQEAD